MAVETIVARELKVPTVTVDSTNAPSLCARAVELSALLTTPVNSLPEMPVKLITSLAFGVLLPDPSCLLITKDPGACKLVTEFKVIPVVCDELIAPFKVVE